MPGDALRHVHKSFFALVNQCQRERASTSCFGFVSSVHAIHFVVFVTPRPVLCFSRHLFVLCGNFFSRALELMSALFFPLM